MTRYATGERVICRYPSGDRRDGVIETVVSIGGLRCHSHPGASAYSVTFPDGSYGVYCEPQLERWQPVVPDVSRETREPR